MYYVLRFFQILGLIVTLAGFIGGIALDSLKYELLVSGAGIIIFFCSHSLLKQYYSR